MADFASRTIDRHEPILPDYIQGELSLEDEILQTKIKNSFVLRYCNVGQIKRWVKAKPKDSGIPPKIITRELLDAGLRAVEHTPELPSDKLEYLRIRGVDAETAKRFKMCSTSDLCDKLSFEEIKNLSLRISDKFSNIVDTHDIDGVSIPQFFNGDFFGFCTRVLNHDMIKYSITIPQRFCWGVDFNRSDEIYVVEGVFDAIPLIVAGYNCMAMGDSQPNYWKMLQANKFKHVYLLFDNDYSGKLGAAKSHVILEEMFSRNPDNMSILQVDSGESIDGFLNGDQYKIKLRDLASELTKLGREI